MARAVVRTGVTDRLETPEDFLREARRYLKNARAILRGVKAVDGYYEDPKKVSEASAMGYLAAELAVEALARFFGESIKRRFKPRKGGKQKTQPSVQKYREFLSRTGKKYSQLRFLIDNFNVIYDFLHIDGYYWGDTDKGKLQTGFTLLEQLIETIEKFIQSMQNSGKKQR